MSDFKKSGSVEEQRKRQQELIELKRQKQLFESDPEEYKPSETPSATAVQTARSKLANFWYYSRFTILGILIVAAILAVGITQCASRTKYDCTVVLYFKHYVSSAMIENLSTIAEQYCEDYNGDGEVNVLVMDCAIPDDERMLETGLAKSTRLTAQFASAEAIVYIVDKEALEELDEIAGGIFVDDSLGLPDYDGKAFSLNGSVFDAAFDTVSNGYSDTFEYYIIRRVVEGTTIDGKGDVDMYSKQADEFIRKIVSDPYLNIENSEDIINQKTAESK